MAPSFVIKVFCDIVCLVLCKPLFVFFCGMVITKRFEPLIESRIEFIFIAIVRIIEDIVMTSVIEPYECEAWIIFVFFIILVQSILDPYNVIISTVYDHH